MRAPPAAPLLPTPPLLVTPPPRSQGHHPHTHTPGQSQCRKAGWGPGSDGAVTPWSSDESDSEVAELIESFCNCSDADATDDDRALEQFWNEVVECPLNRTEHRTEDSGKGIWDYLFPDERQHEPNRGKRPADNAACNPATVKCFRFKSEQVDEPASSSNGGKRLRDQEIVNCDDSHTSPRPKNRVTGKQRDPTQHELHAAEPSAGQPERKRAPSRCTDRGKAKYHRPG